MRWLRAVLAIAVLIAGGKSVLAAENPNWTTPFPAFKIADHLYWVGSKDLGSYLVTTPAGDILINSNLKTSVPQIRKSVESLGFRFKDVKILLISQAHWDHDEGSAELLKETGAKYMVMDSDVSVVESGGRTDFFYGATTRYAPAKVARVLHDGDEVKLGGVVLVAHKTPGHTKGCTTWTMKVTGVGPDKTKVYNAVIVGGYAANTGFQLVGNPKYPGIADDFETTFRVLRGLPCDLFLGAHGQYYGMLDKYARMQQGDTLAFVDPAGYQKAIGVWQAKFETELKRQQAGGKP
jgi:metallo-beta-lactamase class B